MITPTLTKTATEFGVDMKALKRVLQCAIPAYLEVQEFSSRFKMSGKSMDRLEQLLGALDKALFNWNLLSEVTQEAIDNLLYGTTNKPAVGETVAMIREKVADYQDFCLREVGSPRVARTGPLIDIEGIETLIVELMTVWPNENYAAHYRGGGGRGSPEIESRFLKFANCVAKETLEQPPSIQAIATAIRNVVKSGRSPTCTTPT